MFLGRCKSVPLWAASLVCCVDYVCTDTVIARTCSIVADVLVVGVTWWNAYNTARLSNVDIGPTLGRVMLYDGELHSPREAGVSSYCYVSSLR